MASLLQRPKSSFLTGPAPGAWWCEIRRTRVRRRRRRRNRNMVCCPCRLRQAGSYGQLPGVCTVCLHLQWAPRGEVALKHLRRNIWRFAKVDTKYPPHFRVLLKWWPAVMISLLWEPPSSWENFCTWYPWIHSEPCFGGFFALWFFM